MTQQYFNRTAKGIISHFNNIHGIPEGGLLEGRNCSFSRPGCASKSRGRERYGSVAAAMILGMWEYRDRVLRYQGTTLEYDSDGAGAFVALSGSFSPPNSSHRIRAALDRLAFFFSTSLGPYKKATLADAPVRGGIHEGLDLFTTKTGTGGGFMPSDTQVSYRVIFGRKDANDKLLLGGPTWRQIVSNAQTAGLAFANAAGVITVTHTAHGYTTGDLIEVIASSDTAQVSLGVKTITVTGANAYTFAATGAGAGGTITVGKDFNVAVNSTIPTGIGAGDFYRVYRSELSGSASTTPADEHFLIQEVVIVAGDVTNGFVTFTDTLDEAFLGDGLYTNASEEGLPSQNGRPPFCIDLASWKGHMWYLGYRQPHAIDLQLLTVTGLIAGTSTIVITDGTTTRTYTFSAAENVAAQQFLLQTTAATAAQNVEETMKSFCKVVNRDTGQDKWEARYVSQDDDAPGIVEVRRRTVVDTALSFTANSSATGNTITPNLPTSGTTVSTTAERAENGLMRSKFDRPEAVPPGSSDPVGVENRALLRALPLRDSLILVTEQGIFRVSGETDSANGDSFSISQLDPSINGVCPESWVVLNNSAFGLSTQGVVKVDESGTVLISNQIEDELKELFGFSNFQTLTHAVSYESERSYFLYVQEEGSDSLPTIARVYNYLTSTWALREKKITAALVPVSDDKLYEAHGVDFYTLKERKSFTTTGDDYSDEGIAASITAIGTVVNEDGDTVSQLTVTYSYSEFDFQDGMLLLQGIESGLVEDFTELTPTSFLCTMDALLPTVAVAACTLRLPINSRLRWRPEAATNAARMKQFSTVQIYAEANTFFRGHLAFSSDVDANETEVGSIRILPGFGWGESEWGDAGWGDEGQPPSTPLRAFVPREYARCRALNLAFEHRRAKEFFDIVQVTYDFQVYGSETSRLPR